MLALLLQSNKATCKPFMSLGNAIVDTGRCYLSICELLWQEGSVMFWFLLSAIIIGSAFLQGGNEGMLALTGIGALWFLSFCFD